MLEKVNKVIIKTRRVTRFKILLSLFIAVSILTIIYMNLVMAAMITCTVQCDGTNDKNVINRSNQDGDTNGLAGNDKMNSNDYNDDMLGGEGKDQTDGGDGDDVDTRDGPSNDNLFGDAGND